MVDILQVLEGLAYVGFIAGAIFAVMELRGLSRDRKTEMLMRMNDYWCSRDFEEANVKLNEMQTKDPREMEEQCGKLNLWMMMDYLDGIGMMVQARLVDEKFVLNLGAWASLWDRMEPWISDMRRNGRPGLASGFEWLAAEERRIYGREDTAG